MKSFAPIHNRLAKTLSIHLNIPVNTQNPEPLPGPYIITNPAGTESTVTDLTQYAEQRSLKPEHLQQVINQGFYAGYSVRTVKRPMSTLARTAND